MERSKQKAESVAVERIDLRIGLCSVCTNMRPVKGGGDSTFYLCELALTDSRFRKYPGLPVARCEGFRGTADEEPLERQ